MISLENVAPCVVQVRLFIIAKRQATVTVTLTLNASLLDVRRTLHGTTVIVYFLTTCSLFFRVYLVNLYPITTFCRKRKANM